MGDKFLMKIPQVDLRGEMYKLFDSCRFGKGWKRVGKNSENFHDYKSLKDDAKIELEINGIDPESFGFKKNSLVNIKNGILKYNDKDLIKQTALYQN